MRGSHVRLPEALEACLNRRRPEVQVYVPLGGPLPAWAPAISAVPATLIRGATFALTGTQLHPLVRITNNATGHTYYARTHDHSRMGVATGATPVSTRFDGPAGIETGASMLVVIANGIASAPVAVAVT